MPVIWKNPRAAKFATAALCVPCGGCNAEIGRSCKGGWPCWRGRQQKAEALGFFTIEESPLFAAATRGRRP